MRLNGSRAKSKCYTTGWRRHSIHIHKHERLCGRSRLLRVTITKRLGETWVAEAPRKATASAWRAQGSQKARFYSSLDRHEIRRKKKKQTNKQTIRDAIPARGSRSALLDGVASWLRILTILAQAWRTADHVTGSCGETMHRASLQKRRRHCL